MLECDVLCINNGEITNFGIDTFPKIGNRSKCIAIRKFDDGYDIADSGTDSDYFFNNRESYTAESYIDYKTINGCSYQFQSLQKKVRLSFYLLNDDTYIILSAQYDDPSIIIPITYKGKPVTRFDYDFLRDYARYLTDIYYEGTIAQWKHIAGTNGFTKYCTIHCSDGVIEKEADDE